MIWKKRLQEEYYKQLDEYNAYLEEYNTQLDEYIMKLNFLKYKKRTVLE